MTLILKLSGASLRRRGAGLFLKGGDAWGGDRALVYIPERIAHAISGEHTGLRFALHARHKSPEVEKQALVIERVRDRKPGSRAFKLVVGGEDIVRLDDETVRLLEEHATIECPDGPADWDLRAIETMEDEIHEKERELEILRVRRDAARREWSQACERAAPIAPD
ncbi:hypothetical protein GE300_14790 [Rhodobacteraceae bacterium 2CG4]|uniref:Uncharacterized protein n=1 Tax=Halovulum marinum TaxID=2662447 RepID=A0A6L5Z2V0_9RHOB|nr:hypothetical protein [Halovulum marinum]MSU90868.1 hypothetical protein [Halovulum marinum]